MNNNRTDDQVRTATYRILKRIGADAGNNGFKYIIDAVAIVYAEADNKISITQKNGLYDKIAQKHNATIGRVERCIRHSVEILKDTDEIKAIFGTSVSEMTNKSFIYGIVNYLIYENHAIDDVSA